MVQLRILQEAQGGDCLGEFQRFPLQIGRACFHGLRLEADGVWDRHAEIRLLNPEGFQVAALGEGLVTVNDSKVEDAMALRNGDVIGLGSLKILFALSPTIPGSLRWREIMLWTLLALLCLGQVVVVYLLPS